MRRGVIGAILAVFPVVVGAWAQTSGTGAFAQLPPGEQKIVRALFGAQTTGGSATPLTLDEIAAKKQQGSEGWGQVFKQMKAQGLLTEKNLGQVVSNFERQQARGHSGPNRGESAPGASGGGTGRGAGHGGGRR